MHNIQETEGGQKNNPCGYPLHFVSDSSLAMPENDSSTISPQLLSAGLFVVTALASQWLQHHMKRQDEKLKKNRGFDLSVIDLQKQRLKLRQRRRQHDQSRGTSWQDEEDCNNECSDRDEGYREDCEQESRGRRVAFPDYYSLRRQRCRLSCDNLRPLVHEAEMSISPLMSSSLVGTSHPLQKRQVHETFIQQKPSQYETLQQQFRLNETRNSQRENSSSPSPAPSTSRPHHNNTKEKSHIRHRRKRGGSIIDHEDEYDFLPKNSNWNHFERYNEDDLLDSKVPPDSVQPGYHHQNHFPQASSIGYDLNQYESVPKNYESDQQSDNAREEGDAPSESSEEQFVWTEAVHEKPGKRSNVPPLPFMNAQSLQQYQQSVAAPTQERSIESELPITRTQHPMRRDIGSTETARNTDTRQETPVTHPSGANRPADRIQQREFLRRMSGGMNSSSHEGEKPPQRFTSGRPRSTVKNKSQRLQKGSSSVDSAGTNGTDDFSGLSCSSHPPIGQHKDPTISSHRSARAQYNAKIMPNKVVMVRHGQSMGNINEELYSTTPDNAMPLTKLGFEQARKAGQQLKSNVLAPGESVHFIVSPYVRTVETFHGIVSAWCDPNSPEFTSISNREMRLKAWYGRLLEMGLTWHEDPRIREQDFGNYQDPETIRKAKRDRHNFGIFYYRFPHGESASDVFDRVSTFLDSLWRSFDMNRSRNYVLVTHGISIRVLLARYFRYTIHQFNMLANPRNCEMIALGHDGHGRLRLEGRYQLHLKESSKANSKLGANGQHASEQSNEEQKEKENAAATENNLETSNVKGTEVDEYRFYKRLRILPQAAIRKVPIRISYEDEAC